MFKAVKEMFAAVFYCLPANRASRSK